MASLSVWPDIGGKYLAKRKGLLFCMQFPILCGVEAKYLLMYTKQMGYYLGKVKVIWMIDWYVIDLCNAFLA